MPSHDLEKSGSIREEIIEDVDSATHLTAANEKCLLRRIDLFVLPWISLLYAFSLIDRTNIGAANVAGMTKDLNLVGNQYSVALLAFFPPYILFEVPSNYILRRVGTKRYLSILIFCWGMVAMCQGFVQTYGQLIALRVLLGFFELGFSAACVYLIASWYKRYETQTRIAVWYITGSVIAGFNGILSYGLSTMEGKGGLRGWRWIFIVPGAVTIALVIPVFLFISEFPEKARWLSPADLKLVKQRLEEDRGEGEITPITLSVAVEALTDWKIWLMSSLLFFITTGTYALNFFAPSILQGLGFNTALSQILATPPYIFGAILSVATGIIADRMRKRSPFIIGHLIFVIVGFIMMGWGNNTGCKLTGIFFSIAGVNCSIPAVLTFLSNNTVGASKRQIAIPIMTSFAGLGGIAGSLVFRSQDYPQYRPGMYAAFTCMSVAICVTAGLAAYFKKQNDKANREGKVLEGMPGFRYTL